MNSQVLLIYTFIFSSLGVELWPNGIVYYDLHPNLAIDRNFRYSLTKVILKIQLYTCVSFFRATKKTDRILFIYPGRSNYAAHIGQQEVNTVMLFNRDEATILHELMHVLGIHHEQRRSDSRNYIKFNKDKTIANETYNFEPVSDFPPAGSSYPPYSVKTTMHYPLNAFAINDTSTTIELLCHGWEMHPYNMSTNFLYEADRIIAIYNQILNPKCIHGRNGYYEKYSTCIR